MENPDKNPVFRLKNDKYSRTNFDKNFNIDKNGTYLYFQTFTGKMITLQNAMMSERLYENHSDSLSHSNKKGNPKQKNRTVTKGDQTRLGQAAKR